MYLLDANSYIQAKNLHYQMSFCPAYWDWLVCSAFDVPCITIFELLNRLQARFVLAQ